MKAMTPDIRKPRKLTLRSFLGKSGTAFSVAAIAAWSFFPIYWMLLSSLRTQSALFSAPTLWPRNLSLDSYRNLLNVTDYPTQFRNSLIVATSVVIITLVISIVVAYVLTRFRVRGKSFIVAGILYAYMFPPMLLAIPLYGFFVTLGIGDSLLGLVIAHCTLTLPLAIWLLWGFFKSMPFELEEAARVDGCTRLGSFVRVVLPLSIPGIITAGVFTFLLSWTDYVYALVMITSDERKTLPLGIASMIGSFEFRWGEAMAGATLIVIPLFIMFAFLSRFFIQGMSAGAVKG
jgi:ABC-type glycerol-3-phosphate transport system permease component